jgi:hypothetical protein
MLETTQSIFINNEIWILTFGGAFQRSGLYAPSVSEINKSKFRTSIKIKINSLVNSEYKEGSVSSDKHINNLIELKKWINTNHAEVLNNGSIKLGIVQKLLNLNLKYQWCLGLIKTPPHCPFDRIIISKMKLPTPPAWTKLDSVAEYKMLVKEALVLARNKTIAEWELDVFSRR